MKIKQIVFFGFFLVCLNRLSAQEGLPFYEHYLVSDKYHINPSYAGADPDVLTVRGTYRTQWADLPNAPNTQTLLAHATVVDRFALGAYIFNDENGATSLRGVNITGAYHIPIGNENWTRDEENKFSFGLSYNGLSQVFDRSLWNAEHPDDPLLEDDNYFLSYFNIGGSFNYNGLYAGISVLDIPLGDNRAVVNAVEPLPTWYYFLVGYKWNVADGIQLEPSMLMNLNSNSERQIDFNLKAHFGMGENKLMLGVSTRSDKDETGSQSLTIAPLVGLDIGKLRLGYAYSLGASDIAKEAGNGHLISLGFDFGNPFSPNWR